MGGGHLCAVGVALFLGISAGALGQDPAPAEGSDQAVRQWESADSPAASSTDFDAWRQVLAAPSPSGKATLARQFLAGHPSSRYAPEAHYYIAQFEFQSGNTESFVEHGEAAVAGLEGASDLLSQLAFVYAEGKQPELAIARANQALSGAEAVDLPAYEMVPAWVAQVDQVKAESYYALGRAYLDLRGKESGAAADANLHRAINYLEQALRFNPRHDYAALRLGYAYRNAGDVDKMLKAYGRAVALQGVASESARQQLDEVLGIIQTSMADSQWASLSTEAIVTEAGERLQQDLASHQERQAREIRAVQARIPDQDVPGFDRGAVRQP